LNCPIGIGIARGGTTVLEKLKFVCASCTVPLVFVEKAVQKLALESFARNNSFSKASIKQVFYAFVLEPWGRRPWIQLDGHECPR
jgi:hypothetical protein